MLIHHKFCSLVWLPYTHSSAFHTYVPICLAYFEYLNEQENKQRWLDISSIFSFRKSVAFFQDRKPNRRLETRKELQTKLMLMKQFSGIRGSWRAKHEKIESRVKEVVECEKRERHLHRSCGEDTANYRCAKLLGPCASFDYNVLHKFFVAFVFVGISEQM